MHDTARSAWRASKQFASSVITGGVGLSACRQCTRRQSSSLAAGRASGSKKKSKQLSQVEAENCHQMKAELPGEVDQLAELTVQQMKLAGDDDQHTSVIEVQSLQLNASANKAAAVASANIERSQNESNRNSVQVQQQQAEASDQQTSLIRVDENNKLTIVTKFSNDSECQSPNNASLDLAAPSSGSERSRCESSSSGRGTSSDAGSATASQNGDLDENHASPTLPVCQNPSLNGDKGGVATVTTTTTNSSKRHKRRSSLFKASKVFGGSQASLNKLKSFFGGSSGKVSLSNKVPQQPHQIKDGQVRQQVLEGQMNHLESSRLRCLELNRPASIDVGSAPLASSKLELGQGGCEGDLKQQRDLANEIGASLPIMRDDMPGDDVQQHHINQQQVNGSTGNAVVLLVRS